MFLSCDCLYWFSVEGEEDEEDDDDEEEEDVPGLDYLQKENLEVTLNFKVDFHDVMF